MWYCALVYNAVSLGASNRAPLATLVLVHCALIGLRLQLGSGQPSTGQNPSLRSRKI